MDAISTILLVLAAFGGLATVSTAVYALVMVPRFDVSFDNETQRAKVEPGLGTISIRIRNKTLRGITVVQTFYFFHRTFALAKVGIGGREQIGALTMIIPAGPRAGLTYYSLNAPLFFGRGEVMQADLTMLFPVDPGDYPLEVSVWPNLGTERKYSLKVTVKARP